MDLEELDPRQPVKKPLDLSAFSVEELENYIGVLEAEIVRVREAVEKKRAYLSGLNSLFKS